MKKRALWVLAAAFCAAVGLLYLYFTEEGAGLGIPCTFHALTGLYCPGCGASRALRSLLHMDFYRALRYNALFAVAIPFAAVYAIALGVSYIRFGRDEVSGKIPLKAVVAFAVMALLYGVLRNLPAFAFLAPTLI